MDEFAGLNFLIGLPVERPKYDNTFPAVSSDDEFISVAKQRIYERAQELGLSFAREDIIHVRDSGHDIVWLRSILEQVWDEDKQELVYQKVPVVWMEYSHSGQVETKSEDEVLRLTYSIPRPDVRIIYPQLVILRMPDSTIRERTNSHLWQQAN